MSAPRPVLVIPAWNEAANLPRVLRGVGRDAAGFECVVVDDGSADDTARIAREWGATVLRHPFNVGYGAALQTGYRYALRRGAELLVQMDADGQHDPADVPKLVEPVLRGECDLVVGSRFLEPTSYRFGIARRLGRNLFRGLARGFGLRVTDPTSGFQAMNRRVLGLYVGDFFPSDFPDVDVLLAAHRAGLRIAERGVRMAQGGRGSTLHGGLRPVYYLYKMLLAVWAASDGAARRAPGAGDAAGGSSRDGPDPGSAHTS